MKKIMTAVERLELLNKDAVEWRTYINPLAFPHTLHVSPAVERLVAGAFPDAGPLEVLQACAVMASRVLPRLHAMRGSGEYSQAEYLVATPFRAALHFVLWRGRVFVSDAEVLPYE